MGAGGRAGAVCAPGEHRSDDRYGRYAPIFVHRGCIFL